MTACQIEPFVGYNKRAALLNSHLRESLHAIPAAKCWQHCGLINPTNNAVYYIGNKALYRSYRGAILWALSQVKQCYAKFSVVNSLLSLGHFSS